MSEVRDEAGAAPAEGANGGAGDDPVTEGDPSARPDVDEDVTTVEAGDRSGAPARPDAGAGTAGAGRSIPRPKIPRGEPEVRVTLRIHSRWLAAVAFQDHDPDVAETITKAVSTAVTAKVWQEVEALRHKATASHFAIAADHLGHGDLPGGSGGTGDIVRGLARATGIPHWAAVSAGAIVTGLATVAPPHLAATVLRTFGLATYLEGEWLRAGADTEFPPPGIDLSRNTCYLDLTETEAQRFLAAELGQQLPPRLSPVVPPPPPVPSPPPPFDDTDTDTDIDIAPAPAFAPAPAPEVSVAPEVHLPVADPAPSLAPLEPLDALDDGPADGYEDGDDEDDGWDRLDERLGFLATPPRLDDADEPPVTAELPLLPDDPSPTGRRYLATTFVPDLAPAPGAGDDAPAPGPYLATPAPDAEALLTGDRPAPDSSPWRPAQPAARPSSAPAEPAGDAVDPDQGAEPVTTGRHLADEPGRGPVAQEPAPASAPPADTPDAEPATAGPYLAASVADERAAADPTAARSDDRFGRDPSPQAASWAPAQPTADRAPRDEPPSSSAPGPDRTPTGPSVATVAPAADVPPAGDASGDSPRSPAQAAARHAGSAPQAPTTGDRHDSDPSPAPPQPDADPVTSGPYLAATPADPERPAVDQTAAENDDRPGRAPSSPGPASWAPAQAAADRASRDDPPSSSAPEPEQTASGPYLATSVSAPAPPPGDDRPDHDSSPWRPAQPAAHHATTGPDPRPQPADDDPGSTPEPATTDPRPDDAWPPTPPAGAPDTEPATAGPYLAASVADPDRPAVEQATAPGDDRPDHDSSPWRPAQPAAHHATTGPDPRPQPADDDPGSTPEPAMSGPYLAATLADPEPPGVHEAERWRDDDVAPEAPADEPPEPWAPAQPAAHHGAPDPEPDREPASSGRYLAEPAPLDQPPFPVDPHPTPVAGDAPPVAPRGRAKRPRRDPDAPPLPPPPHRPLDLPPPPPPVAPPLPPDIPPPPPEPVPFPGAAPGAGGVAGTGAEVGMDDPEVPRLREPRRLRTVADARAVFQREQQARERRRRLEEEREERERAQRLRRRRRDDD